MLPIKSEKVHTSAAGEYIGDWVYGANDGIITTFAVVSGAAGAQFSTSVILILGLANLVADGISMGMSNYLSLKSRRDYEKRQRRIEEEEVEKFPDVERQEIRDILKRWKVAPEHHDAMVGELTKDKKIWVDIMMREELGIVEQEVGHAARHGLATFVAFGLAGALPLLPYIFPVPPEMQFIVSIAATAVSLFVVGATRSLVTKMSWITSGLQMLGIGALAAGSAYLVGNIVKGVFGITL